nr:hypothetical protein [Paracoccus saliphilus]
MADRNNNRLYFIVGAIVVVVALLFFLMSGERTGVATVDSGVAVVDHAPLDGDTNVVVDTAPDVDTPDVTVETDTPVAEPAPAN